MLKIDIIPDSGEHLSFFLIDGVHLCTLVYTCMNTHNTYPQTYGGRAMPKKRLALSLDEYSFKLISDIAEDLEKTKSEVVIELMHLMGPALVQISACKRMVDQGLKNTGEGAFRAFLEGMKKDFEESMEDAEDTFFSSDSRPEEAAEDMQANARRAYRESSN
jgi:hypothetical protein